MSRHAIYYTGQNLYITPTAIVSIPEYHNPNRKFSRSQIENKKNLLDNRHKGKMSRKAQAKIKNAVNWLCAAAKWKTVFCKKAKRSYMFKVNFITLTLPSYLSRLSANYVRSELLHRFLMAAKYRFGLKNYIWKIERTKRGTLHIHLTTDTFMHFESLRDAWNTILEKKGLLSEWYEAGHNTTPPSTDVHSVRNVQNLAGYLAKYFTKDNEQGEIINGRLWGTNYELSRANKLHVYLDASEVNEVMKPLLSREVDWKRIETKPNSLGEVKTIGEMYFIKPKQWKSVITGRLREEFENHLFHIRYNLQKHPPDYLQLN